MKVIGVYNIKGGVGKTATAVNLAYLTAAQGSRTLVWDLDPQAAATFYFRIKPKIKGGCKALVQGKRTLAAAIKGTDFEHLDLLPADFSFRNLDLALEDAKRPTRRLSQLLAPLSEEYDYLFLDCPPSISLVSENIFLASDAILVPMIPTTLSARTLDQLLAFLQDHARLDRLRVMPLFTMVDRRKRLHLDLLERPREHPAEWLDTHIPYAADVEQMGIHRQPLPTYAPSSAAARAYRALWDELKRKL